MRMRAREGEGQEQGRSDGPEGPGAKLLGAFFVITFFNVEFTLENM